MGDRVGLHGHCNQCYSSDCSYGVSPNFSCATAYCPSDCGSRMHSCKVEEHLQVCRRKVVSCPNACNGCRATMPRARVADHLPRCPASVVFCGMEWNRWPASSRWQAKTVGTPRGNFSQLDVALAFRDQRAVEQAAQAPRRTREVLRNSLTSRYPAAPLPVQPDQISVSQISQSSSDATDDDPQAPWNASKNPPGLSASIISHMQANPLRQVHKDGQGDVDKLWDHRDEFEVNEFNVSCGMCKRRSSSRDDTDRHAETRSAEQNLLAMGDASTSEVFDQERSQTESGEGGDKAKGDEEENAPSSAAIPPAPPVPETLNEVLGVDLTTETFSNFQPKPKAMYSFLCAQEFRRDEYPAHFKNVHCDIHGGLDGWLEHRCPLAVYGCTYSLRRLRPGKPGSKVVHSRQLESFGVCPPPHASEKTPSTTTASDDITPNSSGSSVQDSPGKVLRSQRDSITPEVMTSKSKGARLKVERRERVNSDDAIDFLSTLPLELLRHILSFCDSFSLRSCSLVSKQLREACSTLIDDRGIVKEQWRREGTKWINDCRVWTFSTHFSTVKQWEFEDNPSMGDHMATCPFNNYDPPKDPVKVMALSDSKYDAIYGKGKKSPFEKDE